MMFGVGLRGLSGCAQSQLISPPNYSNIGGPTTFSWTRPDLSCVNWVRLDIGNQPGYKDIFSQVVALQTNGDMPTSITVDIAPTHQILYVSLVTAISYNPISADYQFIATTPTAAPPPVVQAPPPPIPVVVASPPPVVSTPSSLPVFTSTGPVVMQPTVSTQITGPPTAQPVINVGQSGAPVVLPPSSVVNTPVPAAPTSTIIPGAGTSAPQTSTSGTTDISSTTPPTADSTIFGIPTTYALIVGAVLLFLMMEKK